MLYTEIFVGCAEFVISSIYGIGGVWEMGFLPWVDVRKGGRWGGEER